MQVSLWIVCQIEANEFSLKNKKKHHFCLKKYFVKILIEYYILPWMLDNWIFT